MADTAINASELNGGRSSFDPNNASELAAAGGMPKPNFGALPELNSDVVTEDDRAEAQEQARGIKPVPKGGKQPGSHIR